MSCEVCKCGAGLSNTGTACTPVMQTARKIIFVPYYDNNGNINTINLATATLDKAYFDALVNQSDKSKRWFPLPELKNVEDVREANILESFNDGSNVFISEGNRSFTGILVKGTPQLKGKIESARCSEVGVFIIDKDGNLIGSLATATTLAPIRIEESSVAAMLVKTTDTTIQKLQLSYEFHADEKDEDLRFIACSEMTYDVLQIQGLLDIYATFSNITLTDFEVQLSTDYGTILNPVLDKGLLAVDFTLFNDDDQLAVAVISAPESPAGTYTISYAAQGAGEVLFLTPSKDGRDYAAVIVDPIQLP